MAPREKPPAATRGRKNSRDGPAATKKTTRKKPPPKKPVAVEVKQVLREQLRMLYITTDCSLADLAKEPDAPTVRTLERWSAEENWPKVRQVFQEKVREGQRRFNEDRIAQDKAKTLDQRRTLAQVCRVLAMMTSEHLRSPEVIKKLSVFEFSMLIRTAEQVERSTSPKFDRAALKKALDDFMLLLSIDLDEAMREVGIDEVTRANLYRNVTGKWASREFDLPE